MNIGYGKKERRNEGDNQKDRGMGKEESKGETVAGRIERSDPLHSVSSYHYYLRRAFEELETP